MTEPTDVNANNVAIDVPPTSGTDLHGTSGGGRGKKKERNRSLWSDARRHLIRNPIFIVSSLIVLTVLSMVIAPWLWTSQDPYFCPLQRGKAGPTAGHPFGFTLQGCDMYARTIYAAADSIKIAISATLATAIVGGALGTLAAYYGRWVDAILSRLTDIVFGLPFIVGALLFLSIMGTHAVWAIAGVLIVLGWTQLMRIMRGSVLEIMNRDFVRAARGLGASNARIIFRHLLPNSIAPVVVISTVALGGYVSAEATLTFLGVGLRPPDLSWGQLIATGDGYALAGNWHMLVFPCAFLVVTVLAFIMMGDALRDALDPKLR